MPTSATAPGFRRMPRGTVPGKTALVRHGFVRRGALQIRWMHDAAASGTRYVVVDAVTKTDLRETGLAALLDRLSAGGLELASGLADAVCEIYGTADAKAGSPIEFGRAAVIAGSCSAQTLTQIEQMHHAGNLAYFMDAESTLDARRLAAKALDWYDSLAIEITPLIYSAVEMPLISGTGRTIRRNREGPRSERGERTRSAWTGRQRRSPSDNSRKSDLRRSHFCVRHRQRFHRSRSGPRRNMDSYWRPWSAVSTTDQRRRRLSGPARRAARAVDD